ncbi:MAG: LptE family protein [Nitrospirota bacterium]
MRLFVLRFVLLFCFLLLADCGFGKKSITPHTPTISVLFFENGTQESLVDLQFFPILKGQLIQRRMRLVKNPREADFILSGKIVQFGSVFQSLNPSGQATEYRITIGVESILHEKGKGERPLRDAFVSKMTHSGSANYFVSSNSAMDRDARDRAVREASLRVSNRVADSISDFLLEKAQ